MIQNVEKKFKNLKALYEKKKRDYESLKKLFNEYDLEVIRLKKENEALKEKIENFKIDEIKIEYEKKFFELQEKLNHINNLESLHELKSHVLNYPEQFQAVIEGVIEFDILDNSPRIYFLVSDNEIVYVGKTERKFIKRISSHLFEKRGCFNRVFYINVKPELLNQTEKKYIKMFKPVYNIVHNGR